MNFGILEYYIVQQHFRQRRFDKVRTRFNPSTSAVFFARTEKNGENGSAQETL